MCKSSFWLISTFLLVLSISGLSQTKTEPIKEPLNQKFLEHLVKEGIDSVRNSYHLLALSNDSILYVAAKHHANYLKTKKKLSHTEKDNPGFVSPQERAEAYGASSNYYIGENVALNFYLKSLSNKKGNSYVNNTYNQLANDIVTQWVNSPGHFKNIKTPEYNVTGLALSIDRVERSIYIVQKFAELKFQYTFSENQGFFNYSNYKAPKPITKFDSSKMIPHEGKHAWKIKSPSNLNRYLESNQIIDEDPRILKITPKGRSLKVTTQGVRHLAHFVKKRKDGLAIELMNYDEYHCGNPEYYISQSRRNQQCEFSGRLLKPVYFKKLNPKIQQSYRNKYKGFRTKHSMYTSFKDALKPQLKKNFNYRLGKIPKDISGHLEFNLVYLKKNEVVRVRHLSGVCGEKINNYPFPYHVLEFPIDTTELVLPTIDSTYYFYFPKGISTYDINDITPLLYAGFEKYIISNADIKAFASVEGLVSINQKLQTDRAHSILKALQSRQDISIIPSIETETNLELFKNQLDSCDSYSFLNNKSRDFQKNYVDSIVKLDSTYEELALLLDSQRYATIRIKAIYNIKEYKLELLLDYYNQLREKYEGIKDIAQSYPILDKKFERLINTVYLGIKKGEFGKEDLPQFKPPWNRNFAQSLFSYTLISQHLNLTTTKKGQWISLYNLVNVKGFHIPGKIINNALVEEFNNGKTDSIQFAKSAEKLEKTIKLLFNKLNFGEVADSFMVYLYTSILNDVETRGNQDIFERASNFIFNTFHNNHKVAEKEILRMAKLFVFIENYNYAYQLLEPYVNLESPHLKIISLYTKLIYQNINEFPETLYGVWLKTIHPLYEPEEWCKLFVGPCNISFQVFDDESVRDLYCKSCAEFGNYATNPPEEAVFDKK